MAGSGLVLGVMIFLLNAIGGLTIVPSTVKQMQSSSGMASAGVGVALGWANGLSLTYLTAELAPFIAFALSLALVAVVVSRMHETRKNKVTVAALGVFVGAFLFVALSTFTASIVGPTIPTGGMAVGTGFSQPSGAASAGMSQSINFGPLILDSLIIGVGCSILASLTTYLGSSLPKAA